MNTDKFEKHLQSQPARQVPAEWRHEILSVARQAAGAHHSPAVLPGSIMEGGRTAHRVSPTGLSTIGDWLSSLLWPRPVAWAALAVVWLVILVLNFATNAGSPRLAKSTTPPSPQLFMAFQEQQRLLSELIGPREAPAAEPPKPAPPQPRSERRQTLLMA